MLKRTLASLQEQANSYKVVLDKLLNDDQQTFLLRGSVSKWSMETLEMALKHYYAIGRKGYTYFREVGFPLPCVRTLHTHIESLRFKPGIQEEMLSLMVGKIQGIPDKHKMVALNFDEMELNPAYEYDVSTSSFIGHVTLPKNTQVKATKALVVMLKFLTYNWKYLIAWELTGSSVAATHQKEFLTECIRRVEMAGVRVVALISDMGSNNTGTFRDFGVRVNRNERVYGFTHPFSSDGQIYVIPDVPHVVKNIRNMIFSRMK